MTNSLLLIDDDQEFATILQKQLQRHGYNVTLAHRVDTALAEIEKAHFSHAIVDLNLKIESGLRLIPIIKKKCPTAKIVVITGYASLSTSIDAIKLGASYYLAKPVDINDVISAFDQLPEIDSNQSIQSMPLNKDIQVKEWETIHETLKNCAFNISKTAQVLGMHRRTLQRKLKKRMIY